MQRKTLKVYKDVTWAAGSHHEHQWHTPLLMVGTLPGTIEDAVYAMKANDSAAVRVRSAYMEDDMAHSEILLEIQGPTDDDPFRFLGVKWVIKENPASINLFAWPRDSVILAGTGIINWSPRRDGAITRIGYQLERFLELPDCPDLRDHGLLRLRVNMCMIYRQLADDAVEVYMHMQLGGPTIGPESMLLAKVSDDLLGMWRTTRCAENKKLAFLIRSSIANPVVAESTSRCETCDSKTHGPFKQLSSCQACFVTLCPRCAVARKLAYEAADATVKHHTVSNTHSANNGSTCCGHSVPL